MNILVINGSPAGKDSITLQTVLYIQKFFPSVTFSFLHAGRKIRQMEQDFTECEKALKEADLLLFCYPVYTFLVPAQLHRFIELIKVHALDLSGKYATQISTSKHFYDSTAHQFIRDNCEDLGLKYLQGLSADMEDLLQEKGREEALSFFRFVLWNMEHHFSEPAFYPIKNGCLPRAVMADVPAQSQTKKPGKIVVVTDTDWEKKSSLNSMIARFEAVMDREVSVVNLAEFPFAGGCMGCFHCASDGTCIYKDGFDRYLRENIQSAEAIVYAFAIKDHSMGYRFKLYDDRQFCNGHRTVTMGKPVGYMISGELDNEPNLRTLIEARAQVGGNYLAGIATDQTDPDGGIDQMAQTLSYAIENQYLPPKNFYGVGGLKIFRDLIYQMQGLMREDHRFYKKHGFYDFPQKHRGKIAAMYLVGAMMSSKSLKKKIGGRMTEGMLMPYRSVLKKADGNLKKRS